MPGWLRCPAKIWVAEIAAVNDAAIDMLAPAAGETIPEIGFGPAAAWAGSPPPAPTWSASRCHPPCSPRPPAATPTCPPPAAPTCT
jgi:hypothetical protein